MAAEKRAHAQGIGPICRTDLNTEGVEQIDQIPSLGLGKHIAQAGDIGEDCLDLLTSRPREVGWASSSSTSRMNVKSSKSDERRSTSDSRGCASLQAGRR
jgi:hypothetical protein